MANVTIADLTEDTVIEDVDEFEIETAAGSRRISFANIVVGLSSRTFPTLNATTATVGHVAFASALSSDHTYKGFTITGENGGETIAQFEAVYFDFTAGEWLKADANAAGKFPATALAVTSSTDGAAITVLLSGLVRDDTWNWSAGPIYLSATAGALTQTAPSTSGDNVQIIGYAKTADIAYFHFNPTFVEVA